MEEEDFTKLSIDEKINHKSWKARQAGYEQALTLLQNGNVAPFEFDMPLLLRNASNDSNQIAQEMGYSVLVEFFTRFDDNASCNQIYSSVIEKGLSSTRAGIRSKALETLLLCIEISGYEKILNALLAILDHKTPKVVASGVNALNNICSNFGVVDLALKKILKVLPKLFDHKDKNVRAETSALTVGLYKWIGSALLASLNELKPVQLKELTGMFVEGANPIPSRFRRGKKPSAVAVSSTVCNYLEEVVPIAQTVDAFDLADPISFIDKLPKSFYTDIVSPKWKERKDACESLLKLISFPKLEDGRYFELVNVLSKRLQDPNVIVVALVASIIEKLASGLKNGFSQYRNIVVTPLIERMKEKKPSLLECLRAAIDATIASLSSFNDILEDLFSAMAHSNPNIRNESVLIITRFLNSPRAKARLGKGEIKNVCEKMLKAIDDSVPEIRDSAALSMATIFKIFGEKVISPYLERLDKVKLAKITDYSKKIQNEVLQSQTTIQSKSIPAASSGDTKTSVPKKPILKSKSLSKSTLGSSSKSNSYSSIDQIVEQPVKYEFSTDSAVEYVEGIWNPDEIKLLGDGNWKNRLQAITSFKEKLGNMQDVKHEAIIRFLLHAVGWKESNFQVMIGMISIFHTLATPESKFNRACALLIISGLVEKFNDLKIKKISSACLESIITCISLQVVLSESFETIKLMKAPKTITECLLWISQTIRDFGVSGLKIKEVVMFVKNFLSNASATVRANAISILVSIHQFDRPEIRKYLNDVNASVLVQIDAEFLKCTAAIVPVKAQNISTTDPIESFDMPTDINSSLSNELMEQLKNSNWKERKSGLESLMVIIGKSGSIQANLGSEFISCLKSRLSDSNKNLASFSADILGKLAMAIGKSFDKYVRTFIPPVLAQLSDQKAAVRTIALNNFDKIFCVVGISPLSTCIINALSTEQPQIRKELLSWLSAEEKNIEFDLNDANTMIPCILSCLLDRSADVRKAALAVLILLAKKVDAAMIRSKAADIYHGAQYSTLAPYLDALGFKSVDSPITSQAHSVNLKSESKLKPNLKTKLATVILKKDANLTPPLTEMEAGDALLSEDLKLKEQRALMDRGVLKWSFETPRKELIDLLADQCAGNIGAEVISLLFSADHYKEKDFLSGLQLLDSFICNAEISKANIIQRCICNCDLILRYLSIRFFDSNTSIFIKSLDLLENFISVLDEGCYLLNEFEANSFVPFFVSKLGDPKESMRVKLRVILKKLGRVYPVSKLLCHLLKGLDSKNSKTRTECLEEIASLIQRHGSSCFVASKTVPLIATQVGDRDPSCRHAALTAICQINEILGDDIQKHLSKISEKEKDMISERLRRMPSKTLVKKPIQAQKKNASRASTPNFFDENLIEKGVHVNNIPKEFSLDLEKIGLLPSVSSSLATIVDSEKRMDLNTNNNSNLIMSLDQRLQARIELLISELTGLNVEIAMEACRQLEKLLLAHSQNDIIRSTDLIAIMVPLLQTVFETLSKGDQHSPRFCKYLLSLLVQIFSSKESASFVPYISLESCIKDIIYRLVDPNMPIIDPSKNLSRALNMLMVRIIDNCEPNATFRSLLLILKDGSLDEPESLEAINIQKKFTELVMKCLWKITKVIPTFLHSQTLHIDLLLLDVNSFLEAVPPQFWKQKTVTTGVGTADMPLRTVKTILHELVNIAGNDILQFLSILPEQSHTTHYIKQMIQSVKRKGASDKPSIKLDQQDFSSQLDAIFGQIADKEETKIGIERLHAIQKKFPSIMPLIEERLAKTGSYFQGYIRRGLVSLDEKNNTSLNMAPTLSKSPLKAISSTDYDQTLQKLQHLFNHPVEETATKVSSSCQSPAKSYAEKNIKAPGSISRENRSLAVKELKERLARMKMTMTSNQKNDL